MRIFFYNKWSVLKLFQVSNGDNIIFSMPTARTNSVICSNIPKLGHGAENRACYPVLDYMLNEIVLQQNLLQ